MEYRDEAIELNRLDRFSIMMSNVSQIDQLMQYRRLCSPIMYYKITATYFSSLLLCPFSIRFSRCQLARLDVLIITSRFLLSQERQEETRTRAIKRLISCPSSNNDTPTNSMFAH
jgi:hypothetical protein